METHAILAEKSVSISALRNNPAQYFGDQPIAVLSHNKPAGYVIGAELFEEMMKLIGDKEEARTFRGRFRPSGAELTEYCQSGAKALEKAKPEDLEEFTRW
ncbi:MULTISPECIES: type I toxin-antitoxin system antitoxin YafN [Marinobacter]|uniref:type I toxin-antitoxin system antitoxin YafN n=1 Tax=Marinobacter TaxID=2742 RepID=UPI0029438F2E|nr:type I toxin-antitoxin system antitoxin YafN [Marinobacter salarius]WOI20876.1 type I toxin-antitoxin system antitoxin YafN [Marinobacter salarius]|tara:strand:- start:1835 stop:2137 length:303 start_codon:yes stop_codon:yes gene_type:complete